MVSGTWITMEMVSIVQVSTQHTRFRGEAGWTPIVGDWNGNGTTKIGVYKDGILYLDYNGNGVWDSGSDKGFNFGLTSDFDTS